MILSGITKFLIGFFFAIAILIGGGVGAALYFMSRASTYPPKPLFVNDLPTVKGQRPPTATTKSRTQPTTKASSKPTPKQTPASSKPLEAGAYKARVTWSGGLSLRSEPKQNAERIDGLSYNQEVVVLAESPDKSWQKIRLNNGEQQGWIKAGNVQRIKSGQ